MPPSTAKELVTIGTGTVLAERFQVERMLGIGNTAIVYRCLDLHHDRVCALKVLQPNAGQHDSGTFHTRFRIGARMAQQVRHSNVVTIYDFIDRPDLVACAMEYVAGGDLASRLKHDSPLPIPEALRLLAEICDGVQAIHAAGILHRDLKPANILLTETGNAKISDFGIAKNSETPRLTDRGGVVGTLLYVSPELMQGKEASVASDIFSIGVIAYELVTGRAPFEGGTVYEIVQNTLHCTVTPPEDLNPHCPSFLSSIILKALDRDPARRFQSAGEIRVCLAGTQKVFLNSSADTQQISLPVSMPRRRWFAPSAFTPFRLGVGGMLLGILLLGLLISNRGPDAELGPSPQSEESRQGNPAQPTGERAAAIADKEEVSLEPKIDRGAEVIEQAKNRERQSLLYRLVDYVQWPAEKASGPVRVCLLGHDRFGSDFDKFFARVRTADGRGFWVQRYSTNTSAQVLRGCTVLYSSESGVAASAILGEISETAVLSVTEGQIPGGIIAFDNAPSHIGLKVDEKSAERAGLHLKPILRSLSNQ